jgi:formiminotetrahydrofolate cyclodeaminase
VASEIEQLLTDAASRRQRLLELAEADAEAYAAVRAAYQLPRTDEDEQQARASAVERSMQRATQVPVESAEGARAVLGLALRAAQAGNPAVLADVAVAAHLALGALRAAADQARYNCSALTHAAFAQEMRTRIGGALEGADVLASETLQWVERRVGS